MKTEEKSLFGEMDERSFIRFFFIDMLKGKKSEKVRIIANIVRVSKRTVYRWLSNGYVKPSKLAKQNMKDFLGDVFTILHEALPLKGITDWLYGYNKLLKGEKPIDLLQKREHKRVFDAAINLRDDVL